MMHEPMNIKFKQTMYSLVVRFLLGISPASECLVNV